MQPACVHQDVAQPCRSPWPVKEKMRWPCLRWRRWQSSYPVLEAAVDVSDAQFQENQQQMNIITDRLRQDLHTIRHGTDCVI